MCLIIVCQEIIGQRAGGESLSCSTDIQISADVRIIEGRGESQALILEPLSPAVHHIIIQFLLSRRVLRMPYTVGFQLVGHELLS